MKLKRSLCRKLNQLAMKKNYDYSEKGINEFSKNPIEVILKQNCTIKNGCFYGVALRGSAIAQPEKELDEGKISSTAYAGFKLELVNTKEGGSATLPFNPVLNAQRIVMRPIDMFKDGDILTFDTVKIHYPATLSKMAIDPEIDIYFRERKPDK